MRIAAAGFQHETNRFCPFPTTMKDFEKADGWPALTVGSNLVDVFRPANIPLGGCIQYAENRWQLVPILWASAEPAGLVEDDAFECICARIIESIVQALPLDGIYLDLHGAMVTQSFEDGEGIFLSRLRERIGTSIPVAVSLDLHANITPDMVEHTDVITVYRTYPHIDMAKTGYRACELLNEIIETETRPHSQFRKIPFMMPLHTQCTHAEPCQSLYSQLPHANSLRTGIADIALGFPPSDIAQNGPAIVAYDFSAAAAERRIDSLHQAFLAAESSFSVPLHDPGTAIRLALQEYRGTKPVIIADVQDSAGAGATSDTTGVLAALIEAGVQNVVVAAFCDREVAEIAHRLGVGGEFDCVFGGKLVPELFPGYAGTFRVVALSDGRFDYCGAMMGGVSAGLGLTAVIDVVNTDADICIVVTSERHQAVDRAIFTHIGIDPGKKTLIVLKSTLHFRADFEPIAQAVILTESPGLHYCDLSKAPFTRLPSGVRLL